MIQEGVNTHIASQRYRWTLCFRAVRLHFKGDSWLRNHTKRLYPETQHRADVVRMSIEWDKIKYPA